MTLTGMLHGARTVELHLPPPNYSSPNQPSSYYFAEELKVQLFERYRKSLLTPVAKHFSASVQQFWKKLSKLLMAHLAQKG